MPPSRVSIGALITNLVPQGSKPCTYPILFAGEWRGRGAGGGRWEVGVGAVGRLLVRTAYRAPGMYFRAPLSQVYTSIVQLYAE